MAIVQLNLNMRLCTLVELLNLPEGATDLDKESLDKLVRKHYRKQQLIVHVDKHQNLSRCAAPFAKQFYNAICEGNKAVSNGTCLIYHLISLSLVSLYCTYSAFISACRCHSITNLPPNILAYCSERMHLDSHQ